MQDISSSLPAMYCRPIKPNHTQYADGRRAWQTKPKLHLWLAARVVRRLRANAADTEAPTRGEKKGATKLHQGVTNGGLPTRKRMVEAEALLRDAHVKRPQDSQWQPVIEMDAAEAGFSRPMCRTAVASKGER